jgi:hypothetical protein
MIMKKILGAALIFSLLFTGAWKLDHSHKRTFIESIDEKSLSKVIPITNLNTSIERELIEKFKSREYVRIIGITKETN